VLLEEALQCGTNGLDSLIGLAWKHPRNLTDKGRKLGCFSRIAAEMEGQVQRCQRYVAETGTIKNTLNPCRIAPTELAGVFWSDWRRWWHQMADRRNGSSRPSPATQLIGTPRKRTISA